MFQLNGTVGITEVSLDSNDAEEASRRPISPSTIYQFDLQPNTTSTTDCVDGKCARTWFFSWLRPESCTPSLMCSRMTGNPCGEYDLALGVKDSQGEKEHVCYESRVVRTREISRGQMITISLWQLEDAAFDLQCFMWCTVTGDIPEATITKPAQLTTLDKLVGFSDFFRKLSYLMLSVCQVNATAKVEEVPLSNATLPASGYSPAKIYHFTANSDSLDTCTKDICSSSRNFTYRGFSPCNLTMICTKLEKNPCAEFGFRVSLGQQTDEICRVNQKHVWSIVNEQDIQFEMWRVPGASVEMACYVWCTMDGQLPSKKTSDNKTSQLISELVLNIPFISFHS